MGPSQTLAHEFRANFLKSRVLVLASVKSMPMTRPNVGPCVSLRQAASRLARALPPQIFVRSTLDGWLVCACCCSVDDVAVCVYCDYV